MYLQKWQIQLL